LQIAWSMEYRPPDKVGNSSGNSCPEIGAKKFSCNGNEKRPIATAKSKAGAD
jgi:hypothetical protein